MQINMCVTKSVNGVRLYATLCQAYQLQACYANASFAGVFYAL